MMELEHSIRTPLQVTRISGITPGRLDPQSFSKLSSVYLWYKSLPRRRPLPQQIWSLHDDVLVSLDRCWLLLDGSVSGGGHSLGDVGRELLAIELRTIAM